MSTTLTSGSPAAYRRQLSKSKSTPISSRCSVSPERAHPASVEAQNAALASSQALLDTSTKLSQDVLSRWVDVARQAQATTLKTFHSSTKPLGGLTHE